MLSPRRTAELGLASGLLVLVASITILLQGRESLRADRLATDNARHASPVVVITPQSNR